LLSFHNLSCKAHYFTASLNALAGVNLVAILIVSPVFGFFPY